MLNASDNRSESAELIVSIVTYKYPDPQEMDEVKIILAAFLRLGRVTEALELSRKMALAGVQEDGDIEAEALEQAGRRISDIISFIFDTCFTCMFLPLPIWEGHHADSDLTSSQLFHP
jgi:hypothetical protein